MKKILAFLALVLSLYASSDIVIQNAFIKQTLPNSKNSAIFLEIYNNSNQDISLISAKTNIAPVAEIHAHIQENGTMMMRQVPQITIKANSKVELKPGGYHIMLFNIKEAVRKNSKVNLSLKFDNNQTIELKNLDVKEF